MIRGAGSATGRPGDASPTPRNLRLSASRIVYSVAGAGFHGFFTPQPLPSRRRTEVGVTGEKQCAVRIHARDAQELRERIKALEDELRRHDPDEGHEWPRPEEAGPSDRS